MRLLKGLLAGLLLISIHLSASPSATPLPEDYWQELLLETRDAAVERQLQEESRLQLSQQEAATQAQALRNVRRQLAEAETRRVQLEQQQDQLESQQQDAQERLQRRSAALGEVFAVYREEKSNLYGLVSDARYAHQYPELLAFLKPKQQAERLPLISDFYQLWQVLQQGWLATSQVSGYQGEWINPAGQLQSTQLYRLGDLQLMHVQGVLRSQEDAVPSLWSGQPDALLRQNRRFIEQQGGEVTLDPARGLTLQLHSRQPTLWQRVQQGGFVGYLILALGLSGLMVALVQSIRLLQEQRRVHKQLVNPSELQQNNALGRVLQGMNAAGENIDSVPPEALEARLDELLVRESAALEKGLSLVKLLAAMAPLLGLLGTVTGMIATFQAITLFGTGDPAMMASGISQALVTTVLGLLTAVPLLLAHLLLQGRSRQLARILEAESSAWLAQLLSRTAVKGRG